jgi:hypothetical protein
LRRRGKKAEAASKPRSIDEARADFSGYIAADELYDGPFCVTFIVSKSESKRLHYEVPDHETTNEDITRFFRRFKQMTDDRGLTLKGITPDGQAFYPEPNDEVFGKIKHQSCQFDVIKESNKDILKAAAQVRRELKQKKTKRQRGSPSGRQAKRAAQRKRRVQKKIAWLFEHRPMFVKHSLTPKEKRLIQRITRCLDKLHTLRTIMDQVYSLFDCRYRMDTALGKLAKLHSRIKRFTTLSPLLLRKKLRA